MALRGKIIKWNDEKGFGFILPDAGGNQVFVHIKAFPRGTGRPRPGEAVSYELVHDAQGRGRAEKVKLLSTTIGPATMAFIVSGVSVGLLAVAAAIHLLPWMVLWLYLGMSTLLFVLYAIDKSAARKGDQRVPESTLHAISLVGGWPGALCAQQLFRHKTRKMSFVVVFWMTVAANVAGLAVVFLPYGSQYMKIIRGVIS